jgi:hypothetical protein
MQAYWSDEGLRQTVERLAAPAADQREWLQRMRTFPSLDELALEFDDEIQRVRGAGPSLASPALSELDKQLSAMSGTDNGKLWRPEALDGDEWARVRALAAAALSELDR